MDVLDGQERSRDRPRSIRRNSKVARFLQLTRARALQSSLGREDLSRDMTPRRERVSPRATDGGCSECCYFRRRLLAEGVTIFSVSCAQMLMACSVLRPSSISQARNSAMTTLCVEAGEVLA